MSHVSRLWSVSSHVMICPEAWWNNLNKIAFLPSFLMTYTVMISLILYIFPLRLWTSILLGLPINQLDIQTVQLMCADLLAVRSSSSAVISSIILSNIPCHIQAGSTQNYVGVGTILWHAWYQSSLHCLELELQRGKNTIPCLVLTTFTGQAPWHMSL